MKSLSIKARLPAGPEQFWRTMRELTKRQGGFTWREVYVQSSGVQRDAARKYVVACARAGYIQQIDMRGREKVYAVTATSAKSPVIIMRGDDPGTRGLRRQHLWTAMRTLAQFTLRELAASASTDELPISVDTATRYVHQLRTAGLVVYAHDAGKKGISIFRLKPSANSGPRFPRVLEARFVYDPNKQAVVGEAQTCEASS